MPEDVALTVISTFVVTVCALGLDLLLMSLKTGVLTALGKIK